MAHTAPTRERLLALTIAVGLPAAVTTLLSAAYITSGIALAEVPGVPYPSREPHHRREADPRQDPLLR